MNKSFHFQLSCCTCVTVARTTCFSYDHQFVALCILKVSIFTTCQKHCNNACRWLGLSLTSHSMAIRTSPTDSTPVSNRLLIPLSARRRAQTDLQTPCSWLMFKWHSNLQMLHCNLVLPMIITIAIYNTIGGI